MVIADTVATVDGPHDVVFGTYAPYTSLWFNVLTRRLPLHRGLWETAPLVLSLLGVALLVWVSWRLAGRWAAVATLALGVAWSRPVLVTFVAQADHGPAYFVVCLLAAFLVLVAARPRSPAVTVAATLVVGAVAGVNLASDPLVAAVGLAPLVGAPLLAVLRTRSSAAQRALAVAAAAGGLAVAVGLVTARVMDAAGFAVLGVSTGSPLAPASPSGMVANAGRLAENLLRVWSADFVGEPGGVATVARAVLAGPALAAVAVPVVLLVRALRAPATEEEPSARRLHLLFWGLVVAVLLAGSVLSRLATDNAERSVGYLTPVVLAVAATLPLAATRSRRARTGSGVAIGLLCALSAADALWPSLIPAPTRPYVADGPPLLAALEQRGLRRGYAAYASASGFTYQSGGRLTVRPVFPCPAGPGGPSLCGFFANRVASWYEPRPGAPTFVVADPTLPAAVPVPPPAALGRPSEVFTVGSQTVYVYPDDVAARFGPPF